MQNNLKINYLNKKPKNFNHFNIGIIGAGNIVENSHLPVYQQEGLNVINIFDIDYKKSENLRKKFNINKCSKNLNEILDDENIHILDIAVPAKYNKELFNKAVEKKKHILIQKPLSDNIESAYEILKIYNKSNIKSNVNHQMRYSPSIKAAKFILDENILGEIKNFKIFTHRFTDWSLWPWLEKIDYPELRYNSIHYIDTIRFLFGNPISINTNFIKSDNDILDKPTNILIDFNYKSLSGCLDITHNSKLEPEKWKAGFEIIGVNGKCEGVISSMIGNGLKFNDSINISYHKNNLSINENHKLEGRWFSEAFLGPMYSLMNSINNNTQPQTNINDAYQTLLLVERVIKSDILK